MSSRTQSLRKKPSSRAGAGGTRRIQKAAPRSAPNADEERDATRRDKVDSRKSRVGDKIKKRMSMRYADLDVRNISGPQGLVPGVPALPPMPSAARRVSVPNYDDEDEEQAAPRKRMVVDSKAMQADGFDPDACTSYGLILPAVVTNQCPLEL